MPFQEWDPDDASRLHCRRCGRVALSISSGDCEYCGLPWGSPYTHYDALDPHKYYPGPPALGPASSTREITRAYLAARQRCGDVDDETLSIEAAYAVLGNPVQRATYDMSLHFSRDDIAKQIAEPFETRRRLFSIFGWIALLCFFLPGVVGPYAGNTDAGRILGSRLAPDYSSEREYEGCQGSDSICRDGSFLKVVYHSSSEAWGSFLNSRLAPLLMAFLFVALGYYGDLIIGKAAGATIVWLRFEGYPDTAGYLPWGVVMYGGAGMLIWFLFSSS